MPVRRATILVVDDDIFVRRYTSEVFKQAGYTVFEASDSDQALMFWNDYKIDLVITDVVMPGPMTGLELGSRLRSEAPKLPIFYISGNDPEIDVSATLESGVNFLQKPYEPERLLDLVKHALDGPAANPTVL